MATGAPKRTMASYGADATTAENRPRGNHSVSVVCGYTNTRSKVEGDVSFEECTSSRTLFLRTLFLHYLRRESRNVTAASNRFEQGQDVTASPTASPILAL
eukprot:7019338-Pyramimonas_sp.AAC.1